MRTLVPSALAIGAALAPACGGSVLPPEGQLLVHVETDAPLPSRAPDAPPPLFDRLRVELFPPGAREACAGCTREFALDRELVDARRASFGLAPRTRGPGWLVRARLFRAAWLVDGQPPPDVTIEAVARLPPVPDEGVAEATVTLEVEDLARPTGTLDAPSEAAAGAPRGLPVWEPARRAPCAGEPEEGEACVPGGAFWMGDPALATFGPQPFDGDRPRVVALSPFFVDRTETTVAAMRATGAAVSGDPTPATADAECTYTPAPGPNEARPVNCVSPARAEAACAARGRALPTEAQLEYLGGGLRGAPYPWGGDLPRCDDAVFGRDRNGTERSKACVASHGAGLPPVGSGARDRVALAGGEVVDLAGSLVEWARDTWQPQDGPCWGPGVRRDPLCAEPGGDQSARGGAFTLIDVLLRAQVRNHLSRRARAGRDVGFRCVREAR